MTQKQRPIGTGFTATSTPDDVLNGIDLTGKNVIVTGGHSGIGRETTHALAKAGAFVTVGARDRDRAAAALAGNGRIEVGQLDLLDPISIDAFVACYLNSGRPLHILINNAATSNREPAYDIRGYESTFATNHLGHFQLTLGLRSALRSARGARVVNVSSGAHRFSDIRWNDVHFTTGYDCSLAYGQSKTASVLFAVELDRRWASEGIRGYAVHPGVAVATSLARPGVGMFTLDELRALELIDDSGQPIIDPVHEKKTPLQAASTIVFAATSPALVAIGGVYLKDNDISPLNDAPSNIAPDDKRPFVTEVAPHAIDPRSARRLWKMSERLLRRGSLS